ncbi:hypothetical protein WS86_19680 [Burkholderia savannae]|nr:hypothetical protein WS86_19680 [Burkholderia savannae]
MNACRFRLGVAPTIRPKRSRNAFAEPNPASVAICSAADSAVVSGHCCARLARAVCVVYAV